MDRATVAIYERFANLYQLRRRAFQPRLAAQFAARVKPGRMRADLGCGPGLYTGLIGSPVVAVDASAAMLNLARANNPQAHFLQADLEALPFQPESMGGAWASKCLQHLPRTRFPAAIEGIVTALDKGAPFTMTVFPGEGEGPSTDDFPGRLITLWHPDELASVVQSCGLEVDSVSIDYGRLNLTAHR
jgi:trans-aconitate methyltransferase